MTVVRRFIYYLVLILVGLSCAQIAPLSGGPKDNSPPQLIQEGSTPNMQTGFDKQDIQLVFDEWLELKDAFNQVIVSPPLEYSFEVNLKKKTVVFSFDEREQLRDNATYTINFGDAVTDFTEGNVVPDLRFVFSTGRFIDSLEVSGTVVDAITGKPMKDMRVMLYTNLADSVVRTERPFYFSKTDQSGQFLIQNVREDSFKVFVLDNSGFDYLFNSEEEQIGFLEEPIYVGPRNQPDLSLEVFKEDPPFRELKLDATSRGIYKIIYNQPPDPLRTSVGDTSWTIFSESVQDTLRVWYQTGTADTTALYVSLDGQPLDTFLLSVRGKDKVFPLTTTLPFSATPKPFNPLRPVVLPFNQPLRKIDTGLVRLLADTALTPVPATFRIDSLNPKELKVEHRWTAGRSYQLSLDSNALESWLGGTNDTIRRLFTPQDAANFGNIQLTLTDLDATQQYVLQLQEKNKDIGSPLIIQGQPVFTHRFDALPAATYQLLLIVDENRNGRWDTGNYDAGRQPETKLKQALEPLRANWDLETEISITTMGQPQEAAAPPTPEQ